MWHSIKSGSFPVPCTSEKLERMKKPDPMGKPDPKEKVDLIICQ